MATATIECDICNEQYNSNDRKPLCLPCEALCPQHQKALDYFCVDCVESVCFTCCRATHATHKIEMIDDLLQDNENVNGVWAKIRSTLQNKLDSVSSVVTLSDGLSGFIDDIIKLKPDFDGWKDLLLAQKVSTEQDLQLQTCEVMPIGKPWIISSSDEGERALASLASNRQPSHLVVLSSHTRPIPVLGELLSTHTRPIPGLGELLSRLAALYSGDISLLPLDSFWRPAGQSDGGLGNIVDELSTRLTAVYVSPHQVSWDNFNCNIRLDCRADALCCAKLKIRTITNLCCAKGVPNNVGTTLKDRGVEVTRWHFPDIKDQDVAWLSHILSSYSDNCLQSVELVLPRDHLSAVGARQLFQKIPNIRVLYHEPSAAHLTAACRDVHAAADCIELSTTNILQWI
ncbi:uncharacterized protein LOC108680712 [Hyalella azteca]|uniref:Uncharacterized protein LOC108680712 n=1 Tax=Hyalella azteca TaxID=294128 RepID=A0A979FR23_HYAAZ|nr:uncharacterized protein LOC108680712 [Hyalella azteca]